MKIEIQKVNGVDTVVTETTAVNVSPISSGQLKAGIQQIETQLKVYKQALKDVEKAEKELAAMQEKEEQKQEKES